MTQQTRTAGRRALSLLLVLIMALGLLPIAALAAESAPVKVTSAEEFVKGSYIIVVDGGYAMGEYDNGKSAWVTATQVTDDTLSAANTWTVTVNGTKATLTDKNGVTIAPKGGNNNGIKSGSYEWEWSCTDGKFTFTGVGDDTVTLASNTGSDNKFRAYKNATVSGNPASYPSAFTLYKVESGDAPAPEAVAAPKAEPQGGEVVSGTEITLTCATAGASIYYTLDGKDPDSTSTLYIETAKPKIEGEVGTEVTLKAIAIKGEAKSTVQEVKYTVKSGEEPAPAELPFETGDNVVIYAPAYNKALSSNLVSATSYYQAGVDVTVTDGKLTGYMATELWTVTVNDDGTVSFAQDGQKLGMADSYTSMSLGAVNDKWELTALGGGLYNVKNTVRGNYMEWYASKGNWSTYNSKNAATDPQFQLAFYVHTGPAPVKPPIADGNEVALYNASAKMAVDTTFKGATAEIGDDGKLTVKKGDVTFVVEEKNGNFLFKTKSGSLYMTSGATGNSMTLEKEATEYSEWVLEQTEGGWLIKNAKAEYNGNAQYLEYYNGFKPYKYSKSYASAYVFNFYPVGEAEIDVSDLVVSASPASGASVMKGDKVTLSTIEGAEIYYTTDGTDPDAAKAEQKYTAPIVIESVPATIKALAVMPATEEAEVRVGAVITFTYKAGVTTEGYQTYFGQLHSHTNISDGAGSINDAYSHGAEVYSLDFLAVTDHSNSFDNDTDASIGIGNDCAASTEWVTAHKVADDATTETFVGIYGYEMTWSDGFGHMNTFRTPGFESRTNTAFGNKSGATDGYKLYYDKLVSVPEALAQFNHPGTTFGDFQDFDFFTPARDQRITLIEVGNGEGAIGSSGYFPSYEYYTRALDKGWHVAPTNNQDNHKGNWGDSNTARSVVLADALTRDNIYDAIANYRVYATEDNDLSIIYSLNGHIMGSILGEQEKIEIKAEISDPTDSADAKVEVIVNGGKVAASKTLTGCNGTVTFSFDTNAYSYYYLRITQADKNIAVTAPVWTGESVNAGISSLSCDADLVVKDESVNVTASVYNNCMKTMSVTSMTFTEGSTVLKSLTADELAEAGLSAMASGATASYVLPYTPSKAGKTSISVEMKATIDGTEYTFSDNLSLSVTDPSLVTRILVDGTHYNDYVTGYYSGNMGNFSALAAKKNAQVTIKQPGETITAADLEGVSMLVISAPLKKTQSGVTPTTENATFSEDFIKMVADYAKAGGTVVLCGIADYQDSTAGAPFASTEQINPILVAMGATMRLNDDEVLDDDTNYNGGSTQTYRVYMDKFNTEEAAGLFEGMGDKRYSAYSGASIDVGAGTWLVKGSDNCYSINSRTRTAMGEWGSDKPQGSTTSGSYDENTAVVKKGEVVTLATEAVGEGRVYLAGTVFLSNFEISSDGASNDYGDASYANKVILNNLLDGVSIEPTITDIADVRAAYTGEESKGQVFTVEGQITATNVSPNAFYDTIYIQDKTGGLDIYPVATVNDASDSSAYLLGQTVRVTGALDEYQGDIELRAIKVELIDADTTNKVEPTELSLAEAADYGKNGGLLASVSGTVKDYKLTSGQLDNVTLADEEGNEYRLLFNNYIGYSDSTSKKLETLIAKGAALTAVGVVYTDPEGVCLRVRDLSEVEITPPEEVVVEVSTGETAVSDNITDEAAKKAANSVELEDAEGMTEVAEEVKVDVEAAVDEAKNDPEAPEAVKNADNLNVFKQVYLSIEGGSYSEKDGDKPAKLTLEITPMMQVVVSTAGKAEDIELGKNAVTVGEPQKLRNVTGEVTISFEVPDGMATAEELYVLHKSYEYTATVEGSTATFVNPHGFSTFVITSESAAVAELNGTSYTNLADALDDAKNGETVTLLAGADGKKANMGGDSRTITLKNDTDETITVTVNGKKYEIAAGDSVKIKYQAATAKTYEIKLPATTPGGKISSSLPNASRGSTITLTVKPDTGYVLDSLVVVDKDGKKLELKKQAEGKYTFTMPASDVTVKCAFRRGDTTGFVDVPAGEYYADAVIWAVANDVTNGTSDKTFSPNMPCNRAQMVTFLWRAAGRPEPTSMVNPYKDVKIDAYYGKAVLWAIEKGITHGTSDTTFSPDDVCTRAQMATFLWRFAGSPAESAKNTFADVPADTYYTTAVAWAVAKGITNGTGDNTYSPNTECTRAQIVTFLYRLLAK